MARHTPYTAKGIKRLKCCRCGKQGYSSWQACADGRIFRVICKECDIELNRLALSFMNISDWERKIEDYKKKIDK